MRPGITARKETCPSSPHLRPIRTWPNARKRSSPRNSAAEVLLGEIGYLLQSRVGPHAEVTFLRSFDGDGFKVAEVQSTDIGRMAELVETYLDLPLGIVDAAV